MSKRSFFAPLVLVAAALVFSLGSTSQGAIIWDENADEGSLSTDNLSPSLVLPGMNGVLPVGTSTVLGAIELSQGLGNVDVFTFRIALVLA